MATSTDRLAQPADLQVPPDTDTLYEVIDGRIPEKPPMGAFENDIAKFLYDALNDHVRELQQGRVYNELFEEAAEEPTEDESDTSTQANQEQK